MVEAAKIAEEANPELIDVVLLSCQKGSSQGCRSRSVERYSSNVGYYHKVVKAVKLPVTVKTRLGWDENSKIIVDLVEQLHVVSLL